MTLPNTEPGRIDGARHVSEDLSKDQCWELLRSQTTGRVGFVHHGRVMILPVNHLIHRKNIYFRTAAEGLIGEPFARMQVSFQVDDFRMDRSEGWSVLASGPSSHVVEPELLTELWGKAMAEPWAGGGRDLFVRIQVVEMTGRHVYLA
ncbi:pyridoxamine 5'-phosphate oxidase family protein [Arthrobacter sp. StoSoilB5]|uniref:pyridoxamine 5'-phosphate oxidase family protein n=1 Tax=Arthrobacter sp. StoSoilB5 TaxID=2830992 RepID=UPI001CC4EBB4|nr:pyridoxamine 5'-phosphate oxidase family protein [Arthrobacter sp. StoSoilB5]